jgi:ribulose-phosphate 3-epimerase
MDGHFVPNLTFGAPVIKSLHTKHPKDVHLMVSNPEFYIDYLRDFDIYNLTFHIESSKNICRLLSMAKRHYPHVGVSIRPKTKITELSSSVLKLADLILVMSVEPGFSGQKFMAATVAKVSSLNNFKKTYRFKIEVDGGINSKNAVILKRAGADILVVASYLFNNSLKVRLKKLQQIS